jgi:hypothetical protein
VVIEDDRALVVDPDSLVTIEDEAGSARDFSLRETIASGHEAVSLSRDRFGERLNEDPYSHEPETGISSIKTTSWKVTRKRRRGRVGKRSRPARENGSRKEREEDTTKQELANIRAMMVPEPHFFAFLAMGLAVLALRRRTWQGSIP